MCVLEYSQVQDICTIFRGVAKDAVITHSWYKKLFYCIKSLLCTFYSQLHVMIDARLRTIERRENVTIIIPTSMVSDFNISMA